LLNLATGAGKTAIAFQVAWALFQARWNLSGEPTRRPRILFLADRNTLADQALSAFSSFAEDALERITPEEIRKKGAVPKNAAVFFAIYQTFMTGENDPCFHDYPPDFFDFVIVDECHRGGARDESTWRAILEHFAPAVQLGMTATPKREGNADTYAYFGEPVYRYSLKEGVNDGFLVPFKVHQMSTTIDDYVYTPDDEVLEGEVEERRRYTEADFNRIIEIREREAYRVGLFMAMLPPGEKAVVFCATQEHAAAVRDLVNQYKVVHKVSDDPLYCVRITADEGKVGDNYLEAMKENDKSSPLIATTSEKLSTGVDIENLRHIVLMRPIKSMIAFKQIIGRGTRTCDSENKTHFTLYDFVKAYEHFNDPEWDGEPLEPPGAPPEPKESTQPPISPKEDGAEKIRVRLADGKVRLLQNMVSTTFWDESGRPMMASAFIEKLFGDMVPALFKDEAHLRTLWADPDTRKQLLCALHEKGCGDAEIQKLACLIQAQDCDIFDILAYISFALDPVSRQNRADTCERKTLPIYDANIQSFLCFVLRRYIEDGTADLDPDHLPGLLELYCGPMDHVRSCVGDLKLIKMAFRGFQRGLYGTHNSH
jgi:type I restriction enzyme, R subunit